MVGSAVVAMLIVTAGVGITSWIPVRLRLEERLAVGVVVGVFTFSAVCFVAFELWGMGWPAVGAGLFVPGAVGALGAWRSRSRWRYEARVTWRRLRAPAAHATSLRPLGVLTVASAAVTTRTLALAYQSSPTGLRAGSLATWADWAAHSAYAGSFAYGDNRELELPTATGTGFRYHFLVDFFGSVFTVSGATLQQSLVISVWVLAIAMPVLVWCAVERITGSRVASALTLVLFVLSGGLGAWWFAEDVQDQGWHIVTALPRTYARIPEADIWVDNTISASFYAQRSTLLGWSAGFAALVLLLAARPGWRRGGFLAAGLLVGATGIAQAHLLGTGVALGAMAALADRRRTWWWFLVPAVVVGVPLTVAIAPERNSMRWMLGWMAQDADQPWLWFWLRNVGLLLPLFLAISLLGGVPRRVRRMTAPLWLWFVVPNLIAFHPSEWNNTKFFLFWQFAGCLAIGTWLARAFDETSSRAAGVPRGVLQFAAATCVVVMVSAGGLDAVRAMQRAGAIDWIDQDDMAAATWVRDHTDPDAVIVYVADNTSAVAALSGRRAVSGYPGWTYDLGIPDWAARWNASRTILRGDDGTSGLVEDYGVDYVVIGPDERREFGASDAYWRTAGRLVFEAGEYRVYAVA